MGKALSKDTSIGIIGAGTMGSGIAQVAAAAGHQALLYDVQEDALEKGMAALKTSVSKGVEKGKITDGDALLSRINPANTLEDLSRAGLIVEAIVEDADIKRDVFEKLEGLVTDDCILASNTSSISITALGRGLKKPGRLVGMHFFNPAQIMKLVEVISGLETDSAVAETAFRTAEAWGKVAVHARSVPGFIVNRLARPFYYEAFRALEEGVAAPHVIDAVITAMGGFRMGPLALTDLIGQDVNYAVAKSIYDGYSGAVRFRPSLMQQDLVAAGRLGRKSGRGISDREADIAGEFYPPSGKKSGALQVAGNMGPAEALIERFDAAGIPLSRTADIPAGCFAHEGVSLALTDGRTATHRTQEADMPVAVFDLALDYGKTDLIAIALPEGADDSIAEAAARPFQAAGMDVIFVKDSPGLLVMRTVLGLVNTAADALRDKVASAGDIDRAMTYGLNYPAGPLEWGDKAGLKLLKRTGENLVEATGAPFYWPAEVLLNCIASNRNLTDN